MAERAEVDRHERTAALLWGPPRVPSRGPRPKLSQDRIVGAAVALADAEGIEAVSMQRVASELGYTKMSLYRYVSRRDELLALMTDAAHGPAPGVGGPELGWRERLRAWGRALWPVLREHPWLLRTAVGVRVMGPNELAWTESALRALSGSGLGGAERLDAVALVAGHVRGIAQQALPTEPGPQGPQEGEGAEEAILRAMAPVLAQHGERYPETAAAFSGGEGRDSALEFGLECILDGLERRIGQDSGR
ncbi:TetR/AcrR family transcriptional regulator [Nocardiopsis oceani]